MQAEKRKQHTKGFTDDYKENFRFFKRIQAGCLTEALSAGLYKIFAGSFQALGQSAAIALSPGLYTSFF